jgi:hypothetical protein
MLAWERIWALFLRVEGYLSSCVQESEHQEHVLPLVLQEIYQK